MVLYQVRLLQIFSPKLGLGFHSLDSDFGRTEIFNFNKPSLSILSWIMPLMLYKKALTTVIYISILSSRSFIALGFALRL